MLSNPLLTLHRCKTLLKGQSLADALALRKSEIVEGLRKIFDSDDWEKEYREFAEKIRVERETGLAYVPLLAVGHKTNISELAVALVATEILEYRKGNKPKSPQESASDKLKVMMNGTGLRRSRQR